MQDTIDQIIYMIQTQDSINTTIKPDWREANLPFSRAIWLECAELMESMDWKWWASSEVDPMNQLVEMADIWHFGLSMLIIQAGTSDNAAEVLANEIYLIYRTAVRDAVEDPSTTEEFLDILAGSACSGNFPLGIYLCLLHRFDISMEDLCKVYAGKAALNKLRSANGYASGDYIKQWYAREDNAVMMKILQETELTSIEEFFDDVYNDLDEIYKKIEEKEPSDRYFQLFVKTEIPFEAVQSDPDIEADNSEENGFGDL